MSGAKRDALVLTIVLFGVPGWAMLVSPESQRMTAAGIVADTALRTSQDSDIPLPEGPATLFGLEIDDAFRSVSFTIDPKVLLEQSSSISYSPSHFTGSVVSQGTYVINKTPVSRIR
jgi:hypothetical protein